MDEMNIDDSHQTDTYESSPEGNQELESNYDQPEESQGEQSYAEWMADKRYETMWKKSPNELYKSYREMEKFIDPLKKQVSEREQQLTKLQEEVGKFSELQQVLNLIQSNPRYSQSTNEFFSNLANQIKRDKYGDLPDDVIAKLSEVDQIKQQMQLAEQQQEEARNVEVAKRGLTEVGEFAKQNGIEYDQQEFVDAFLASGLPLSAMMTFFRSAALDSIRENAAMSATKNIRGNLEKNRSGALPVSGRRSTGMASKAGPKTLDQLFAESVNFK